MSKLEIALTAVKTAESEIEKMSTLSYDEIKSLHDGLHDAAEVLGKHPIQHGVDYRLAKVLKHRFKSVMTRLMTPVSPETMHLPAPPAEIRLTMAAE